MTLRCWSRVLGGVLWSLWTVGAWGSEVVDRPGAGAKSYIETFDVIQEVDTAAGLTPYLDETTVFDGALEQISFVSTSITVPFDAVPGAYDYDPNKIVFENGEATLRPDPLWPSVLGTWRFEEAAWDGTAGEVSDGTGDAAGSILGQAQTTLGQVGRAATFDGQGDAVVLGQGGGLALDPNQEFTLSAWFRTSGDGALIAKADSDFGARQFYLFVAGGRLWGAVGGSQHQGLSSGVSDGQWHHGVLVNHDDGGVMRFTLYVDGVDDGTFDSGTATNGADVLLGARRDSGNSGLAFELGGEMDEVALLDRALSSAEVLDLYAAGAGRSLAPYPSDGPSITNNFGTHLFNVSTFRVFEATPSAGHAGQLGFQVSTDGETWQAWSGSSWDVVTDTTSNDAATVESHLSALDLTGGAYLFVRTFLLSDGTQPAGIDKLYWVADLDPVFEAREILGPITADLAFERLQAEITNTDSHFDLRLRLLGDDAETPVDEGLLAGNLAGFDEDDLTAPGVDLSSMPAGSYYLQAVFENPLGRYGDSARLESFQVDYQESLGSADLTVHLSGGLEPIRAGQQVDVTIEVQNLSAVSLAEPSLDLTLPPMLSVSSWTPPSGWTCDGTLCSAMALAPDVTDSIEVTLQVGAVTVSQAVTVAATVDGLNDSDAGNNSAQLQLALDPAVQPRLNIVHQAEPADGTNVTYSLAGGPSVVLDDAVPDDGDGFGDQAELPLETGTVYTVDPSPPVGWLLDDVQCSASQHTGTFQEAFSTDSGMIYDSVAIEVADGVARLLEDPLAQHIVAQWCFEEAAWDGTPGEVADSSGNGRVGSVLGDANTVGDGLLGNAATFDGQGDAVQLGQPSALDLDPTQPFTVSLWFRTLGNGALIAKANGDFNQRQFYLFVIDDRLWGTVGGSQHSGGTAGVSDGQWHHAALVNGGLGGPSTFTLYVDGQPDGTFSAGSATNGLDVLLGARRDQGNNGLAFQLDGELDEVALLDRALTTEEVQSLYAAGNGRLLGGFPSDTPSITAALSPVDPGWTAFSGFEEELGLGHDGLLTYQLSTDGSSWLWFDGGLWSPVGGEPNLAQSNDAFTINAHIASLGYDTSQGALQIRAFLHSDGLQQVELDRLRVLYTSDGLGGVSVQGSVGIDTTVSPDVTCRFSWITDPDRYGALTLIQTSNPADGTDFAYTADLGGQQESFFLDADNDGDGVASMRVWTEVEPGPVTVSYTGSEPGWYLDSMQCVDPDGSTLRTSYDLADDYSFDTEAIDVSGGVARLLSDPLFDDLLGYWRMDEATWAATPVADSSGLGLDASAVGQADTVSGLLGRGGSFDGDGDAVRIGQPLHLDLAPDLDDFSVSAWFRTAGDGAIVGKAEDAFGNRQVYLFIAGGQVHANVGGVQNAGSGSFADNQWHHVVLVNDASGSSAEHHLYVDGVLRGTFPSGSATNGADWMVGARRQSGNVGTAFELSGEVDEVAIFSRALGSDAIDTLYGNGDGRALGAFPSHGPSIVKTAGDSASYLRLRSFTVLGDTDRLAFQLSTDGTNWQYWDGALWLPATDPSQRNEAATVSAYIHQLETSSESIFVRAFLLSDGTQAVHLDEIQVGYDQLGGISTEVDYDQGILSMDLQGGQNVQCTVHHVQDIKPSGSLRVHMTTTPSTDVTFFTYLVTPDGNTDVEFLPDGGFLEFNGLVGGFYEVLSGFPAGWERTDVQCVSGPAGDQAFRVDYDSPADFTFDEDRIEVAGGLAKLRGDALWPDLLAYWHLDEGAWSGTPGEVIDATGNVHHGVALGGADTVQGLEGRAGDFNGSTAAVSFGNPAALDLQPGSDPFTVSAWFRTTGDGAIVGKAGGSLAQRQFYLFVLDDRLWSIVGGELHSESSGLPVADGAWHHAALVNYVAGDGTLRHTLYFDGKAAGDFASGSATNSADILLGARRADDSGGGLAFQLDGQVDEVMILGRALDSDEITALYSENGRYREPFPSDEPSITQRGYMTGEVSEFIGVFEDVGSEHAGQVAYQVDLGDGVWRYWDGADWVPAADDTEHNPLAELSQGLSTLQPLSIRFRLKAFLVSDGTQPVEIAAAVLFYHHDSSVDFQWSFGAVNVEVRPGQEVDCFLENLQRHAASILKVSLRTESADGTDYQFELDQFEPMSITYTVDDEPVDTDGVEDTFNVLAQGGNTYEFQLLSPLDTGLKSILCTGNAVAPGYSPESRTLFITVEPGENVGCELSYERWGLRTASYESLTDSSGSGFGTYAADRTGTRLMTMAAEDLTGDNPDRFPEAFTYETATESWYQLTDNAQASTGRIDVSSNGQWSVLPMRWDPNGFNADNNGEIFRFDLATGQVTQVTDTVACDTFAPAVSDDGTRVALSTDCFSGDGSLDVVLMDGPNVVTLAPTTGCESRFPKITADGSLVTFVSDCDWLGLNPDQSDEIFQWRWQDGPLALEQWTDVDGSIGAYISSHQVSDDGRYLAIMTNNLLDETTDPLLLEGIVRRDRLTGERLSLYPETYSVLPFAGEFAQPYLPLAMDAAGRHVAFYGTPHDPTGNGTEEEPRRWYWCEITEVGGQICNTFGLGDTIPNAALALLGRAHVTWDGAGTPTIYLLSPLDFDGSNSDGSEEIWRVTFE